MRPSRRLLACVAPLLVMSSFALGADGDGSRTKAAFFTISHAIEITYLANESPIGNGEYTRIVQGDPLWASMFKRLPKDSGLVDKDGVLSDEWGHPFKIIVTDTFVKMLSGGPDGDLKTERDNLEQSMMPKPKPVPR